MVIIDWLYGLRPLDSAITHGGYMRLKALIGLAIY